MPKGVEFWKRIGETLRQQRLAAGHQTPQSFKRAHHDAPNERTIVAIEDGHPGHVGSLRDYCAVLGMRWEDVVQSALPGAGVTAEALRVARAYDHAEPWVQRAIRALLIDRNEQRRQLFRSA